MSITFDPEGNEARQVHHLAGLPNDARVLEIGCGFGRLTWHYADSVRSVVGLDANDKWLSQAFKKRPAELREKVVFVQALGEALPLASQTFDLAIFARSL